MYLVWMEYLVDAAAIIAAIVFALLWLRERRRFDMALKLDCPGRSYGGGSADVRFRNHEGS